MIERTINWQHALRFLDHAQTVNWEPPAIAAIEVNYTTLIRFTHRLPVFEIRDWIHESVGGNYRLSSIHARDANTMTISILPTYIRLAFFDIETSTFFKLRWL
jgi:hypothetical protein